MNEILSTAIALLSLVAALVGLVAWVRRDTFSGPQLRRPKAPSTLESDPRSNPVTPLPVRKPAARRTSALQLN